VRYLIHHLLEGSASRHPDDVAVVDRDRSLSYRQLDEQSNRLASLLVQIGVVKGDRVGLYLDKSLESLVAVYGIMKSGAAYVPLDPDAPVNRLAYIANNCDLACLVTAGEKGEQIAVMLAAGAPLKTVVVLNGEATDLFHQGVAALGKSDIDASPADPLTTDVIDQDLAYILYTSGSTGDPKGVMLTHRNALAFITWAAEEFGIEHTDRLASHAPLHFDLSIFDLYAAAYGGAAVVLVPPKASLFPNQIVRFIQDQAITVWYSVPSILSMVTLRGGLAKTTLPSLRTILFAGEVFPIKYLRELMSLVPQARFANLYGPTETNVCTWYEVPPLDDNVTEPVPIGVAVANDSVFAVKEDGQVAQPGEVGELYVRGATVMRGYWGDAERTARGLVPDPMGSAFADPVYRTGDLVEAQPDGCYRYVGRRDAQVKSRGYRIELGDVETAVNQYPGVVECAVVAVPDELVTNRLIAFVALRDDSTDHDLARFCGERLPRYMVPESFTRLAELPKTSTGKIDRRSLLVHAEGLPQIKG
jgi:amino acid adenylation domain-containing protein